MAGEGSGAGVEMGALIRRLRLHQAGPSPYDPAPAGTPAIDGGEQLFRPRRAAVLVCLFRAAAGELRVILTKRSSSLSTHSGEVSLPGGKAEEGDADDVATALRESKEEIGLDPALVTVVASLEHFLSKHLLVVVPVIGILSDIQAFIPVLNVAEVDEIFDVPLEMFLKKNYPWMRTGHPRSGKRWGRHSQFITSLTQKGTRST
uniref:Nudix hydrolase domain-containing protein n=1 Tax=Setaria viridis TaxID=4556 RepID=A0A4U6U3E1_SETVI|nr:hypothetical protein SEVIR_6G100400v2 [Setaria viridis]